VTELAERLDWQTHTATVDASKSTVTSAMDIMAVVKKEGFATLPNFRPRPGHIYTRTRAISARVNQNFDGFPSEELKKSYKTFLGKPVFVNHENADPTKARGRVVAALFVENGNDKYIDVIQEVNAIKYPKLARELTTGGLDAVSMGCSAERTICSYCGNVATGMFDMCTHVLNNKGQKLSRRNPDGTIESVLVYEECRDIGFFELSYVFDPADETALVSNVLVAAKTAARSNKARYYCDLPGCSHWTVPDTSTWASWVHPGGEGRVFDFCCTEHFDAYKVRTPNWAHEAYISNPIKAAYMERLGFGEVEAPQPVDTLRPESDSDTDDFHHYVESPDILSDPDLTKAKDLERREEDGITPVPADESLDPTKQDLSEDMADELHGNEDYVDEADHPLAEGGTPKEGDQPFSGGDAVPGEEGAVFKDGDAPFSGGDAVPVGTDERAPAERFGPNDRGEDESAGDADPAAPFTDDNVEDPNDGPAPDEIEEDQVTDERPRATEQQKLWPPNRRGGSNRTSSQINEQDTTARKDNVMGQDSLAERGRVASRARVAEDKSRNDQGEQEEVFITQTPPEEPVETGGGEKIENSEGNLVARRKREQAALLERRARQLRAEAQGEIPNETAQPDERIDPWEPVEETQPKDAAKHNAARRAEAAIRQRHMHFARWVRDTQGKGIREASHPQELIRWASMYGKAAGLAARDMYPIVQHEVRNLERAAARKQAGEVPESFKQNWGDKDGKPADDKTADEPNDSEQSDSGSDSDDKLPDFLKDKESAKKKTKTAEDAKLDTAAPDGRVDVEAPTRDTTDEDAQEGQFDKRDFGDNAGDDLADPDLSTDQNWLPGEGKTSAVKVADGLQAVRLARAYIEAGLEPKENEWKLAESFTQVSAAVVADRTALLDRVIATHGSRTAQNKTAGSRGAARVRSAVPPNLTHQAPAQQREASAEVGNSDYDLFL